MARLTSMGVRVFPEARRADAKMMLEARNSMGRDTMAKYCPAVSRISGAAFSQPGISGLSPTVMIPITVPKISTAKMDWPAAARAVRSSRAPKAREMHARKPTPMANMGELTSQFTGVVSPTAAVACAPSCPTMAESAYCTTVCSSCSSMAGQARVKMAPSRARFFRR